VDDEETPSSLGETVRRAERLLEALQWLEDRLDAIRLDRRLRDIEKY
jgi:hypothetical protein